MIAELLHALGLQGTIVTAAVVLFGLYHIRGVVQVLSAIGTMLWIATVGVGLFVALVFAMPGVDLAVQLGVVIDTLLGLGGQAFDLLMRFVHLAGVLG